MILWTIEHCSKLQNTLLISIILHVLSSFLWYLFCLFVCLFFHFCILHNRSGRLSWIIAVNFYICNIKLTWENFVLPIDSNSIFALLRGRFKASNTKSETFIQILVSQTICHPTLMRQLLMQCSSCIYKKQFLEHLEPFLVIFLLEYVLNSEINYIWCLTKYIRYQSKIAKEMKNQKTSVGSQTIRSLVLGSTYQITG